MVDGLKYNWEYNNQGKPTPTSLEMTFTITVISTETNVLWEFS